MPNFTDFYNSVLELSKSFEEKNLQLRIEFDEENHVLKVFGEKTSSLSRAKNGIEDVGELAYTTAEHHPYWNLLYHCTDISKTLLEKWLANLTETELKEISWSLDEMKHTVKNLTEKQEKHE